MNLPLYDAGALIAAEANDRVVWKLHRRARERGYVPIVPATVMAQAVRSSEQANLNRLLRNCTIVPLDSAGAREIGRLLAASGTADIVDADVVRAALAADATVLTSDRVDLERIAASVGSELTILDV